MISFDIFAVYLTLFNSGIFYFGFGIGRKEAGVKCAIENCINSITFNNKDLKKFKQIFFSIESDFDIPQENPLLVSSSTLKEYFGTDDILFSTIPNNDIKSEIRVLLIVGGYDIDDLSFEQYNMIREVSLGF